MLEMLVSLHMVHSYRHAQDIPTNKFLHYSNMNLEQNKTNTCGILVVLEVKSHCNFLNGTSRTKEL